MNTMQMIMNQILARHPEARQLYETLKSKSPDELRQYAENVAKGKGIDLQNYLGQYGFRY